jgi:DNA gyrase subunit B
VGTNDGSYDARSIEVLDGIDSVRKRPGMYIGDVDDGSGLHHLIWEVVSNVVDQHLARRAAQLGVDVSSGWVTVEDDGPGIPCRTHRGQHVLELIFTTLHPGPTRDMHTPHVHLTRTVHGVGLAPVNAVCARLEVETHYEGRVWRAAFERGRVVEPPAVYGPTSRTGTRVRFRPDPTIFSSAIDDAAVGARLAELAWLYPLLAIRWQGATLPGRGGPPTWIRALASGPLAGDAVVAALRTFDDVQVDVALAWDGDGPARLRSYVNGVRTVSGTHERGLRRGLRKLARKLGSTASSRTVDEQLAPGMIAILHVGLLDPRFGGPCRDHLETPHAAPAVSRAIEDAIEHAIAQTPALRAFLRERLGC